LLQDAGHMAKASHLGVDINPRYVAIVDALATYCQAQGLQPVDLAMNGGEDYELAFAIDPKASEETLELFREEFRTEVSVVGEFTDEWSGVRVDGETVEHLGFDHFRPEREPE
jgi:thiamine-monophosphate kinase